jgi:hypothetical protein
MQEIECPEPTPDSELSELLSGLAKGFLSVVILIAENTVVDDCLKLDKIICNIPLDC